MVELYRLEINEREEKQDAWQDLYAAYQNQTILQGDILGIEEYKIENKKVYALIVMFDNVKGIIPQNESGINYPKDENGQSKKTLSKQEQVSVKKQMLDLIGQTEPVKVMEIHRDDETVVLSRKAAMEHLAGITWKKLLKEMVVTGKVRQINREKITLEIGGVITSIPKEELSWGFIADPWVLVKKGQKLKVKVMEIDKEKQVLKVSPRECLPNPWPECTKRYLKLNLYRGKVTKVIDQAVFVNLEPGVDVYCQHMKFDKLESGDIVVVKINGIDPKSKSIWGSLTNKIDTKQHYAR